MENFTITPVTDTARWQLPLTAAPTFVCAASAATPATSAFGAVAAAVVVAAQQPVKRDRALTGAGMRGIAGNAPGIPAWSPPI